jgi:DNA-binding transcriptional ArsR family regulator
MHELLNDPSRLQEALVDLLDTLWFDYFKPEWEVVRPGLESVVRAMSAVALDTLPLYEAMQAVTGRDLRGIFDDEELATFERIEFIPSKHNGPYISWFGNAHTLWIAYGARMPAADLVDTDQLLNYLNALGDATRLNILKALREQGELSTQQIMDLFDLNKSAASRHLRQLRANELIVEHREPDNKTKIYSLHSDTIAEVIKNIAQLLGKY